MTSDVDRLRTRVRELADRAEITDLVSRYVILLDTQDDLGFDDCWPRSVFTEDVRLEFPLGTFQGLDGLAEFHHRAKAKFARTHHLAANHLVELSGDTATVRCQMLATHVQTEQARAQAGPDLAPLFEVGGYYLAEAVRTPDGWRFRSWTCRVVWHQGTGQVPLD
ncbi:nuclear transport factor 2 family protein [Streptomyces sparsus]